MTLMYINHFFGTSWAIIGNFLLYLSFSGCLGLSRSIPGYIQLSCALSSILGYLVLSHTIITLGNLGLILALLPISGNHGKSWAILVYLGRYWAISDYLGQSLTISYNLGQSWPITDNLVNQNLSFFPQI